MLKDAYGFFKRARGKDHRDTAKILILVVGLAELSNQFEKAEGMLERCLAPFSSGSPEDLVFQRLIAVDLAAMLEIRGQAAEGLKRLDAVLPPEPVAAADVALASCLVAQRSRLLFRLGRRDEALAAARRARALVDQAPPLGSPLRPSALGVVADAFLRLGDLEAAASLLERSLATRVAVPGRPPGFAGSLVQAALAEVQALLGNHERAATLLHEGRAVVTKTLGKESPLAALADHAVALELEHQGKAEQAWALALDAAARLEKLLGKDYPDAVRVRATATRLEAGP